MADTIFEHPRLVSIYDAFDGQRSDLVPYLGLLRELGAQSVLDIGCGTGSFACLASEHGLKVTAIDPAKASVAIAQGKRNADHVRWLVGDATTLPVLEVDVAVMTGNVAQVFTVDEAWTENLRCIRQALRSGGSLVFEVRDPDRKAWLDWTPQMTRQRLLVPEHGYVQGWCEVLQVVGELVSFRWTYLFESDGAEISSDSTIRFRNRDAIEQSVVEAGYEIREVRDAPDRPGREFVFVCSTPSTS